MHLAPALPRIARNRFAILEFARRMTDEGQVTITAPGRPDLSALAVHDPEQSGYGVILISVSGGVPVTELVDFDFDETSAARHTFDEDGNGLAIRDTDGTILAHYRLG